MLATVAAGVWYLGVHRANKEFVEDVKDMISTDSIKVFYPTPNAEVDPAKPLVVSGEARGAWYFEASFPMRVEDANGKTIAQSHVEAQSDWMTEEFVPFEGKIIFSETPATQTGALVLEEDDPSGMGNPESVRFPLRFP